MKKYLIMIAVVLTTLVGCGDNDDNDNNVNTGNGSENEEMEEGTRGFSCTRSGSNEIVLIGISEDRNSVIVNPGIDNDVYNRADVADDSDNDTDSFVEYRRPSLPEDPDEIKLSATMVNGAETGTLVYKDVNYSCNDI